MLRFSARRNSDFGGPSGKASCSATLLRIVKSLLVSPFGGKRTCRTRRKQERFANYDVLENRQVLSAMFPAWVDGSYSLGEPSNPAPYGLANTFKLQSKPNATKTIYLDFTGHRSVNNDWNHNIYFEPYDKDGRPNQFTDAELIEIQRVFQGVAEDFIPLNVNVTTQQPPASDLVKSSAGDTRYGIRVVMTQHVGGFADNFGGIALRDSFMDDRDTPVFAFAKGRNNAAVLASHEVGHSLGLSHDGGPGTEYYRGGGSGDTSWAPLMGSGYSRNLTQWNQGDYPGATNQEDDLAVMTRSETGVFHTHDDRGDTFQNAHDLRVTGLKIFDNGRITARDDVDMYKFETPGGRVTLNVRPYGGFGNLDVSAKLYNSSGDLIASQNPANRTFAVINLTLDSGTYYLAVDGVGKAGAYSDYGSLGFYTIGGRLTPNTHFVGESGIVKRLTHNWRTVQFDRTYNDPVVVAGPPSLNGTDATTVRIRNVTSNGFEIQLDEWDYLNGTHVAEEVSYVVMEAGTHQLPDGTKIVAQNSYVNHDFRRIGFGSHFELRPIVLGQTVTTNGPSAVTTRVRMTNTGGFDIKLQEQELSDGTHSYETVSWLAIERGITQTNGLDVEAGFAADRVDHEGYRLQFQNQFSNKPVFLAGMQSYVGANTANIRLTDINRNNTGILISEETSLDPETEHDEELIGYFAITRGLIKAIDDSPEQPGPDAPVKDWLPAKGYFDQENPLVEAIPDDKFTESSAQYGPFDLPGDFIFGEETGLQLPGDVELSPEEPEVTSGAVHDGCCCAFCSGIPMPE
ncbi:MAG: pre-peptidase C-terminal domain-containing protein [Planctomycetota bacterium]